MTRVTPNGDAPSPGAYGMALPGVAEAVAAMLPAAGPGWDPWHLEMRQGSGGTLPQVFERGAYLPAGPRGIITLRRSTRVVTVTVPDPTDVVPLLHPFLSTVAAVTSRWRGDLAFHAAGVVLGGRAWGVVGEREAGKSTLVATLAAAGVPVLSDDLLVVSGGRALAGPRCADLREPTATALGVGEPVQRAGVVRWRTALGPVPGEIEMAGWLFPDWSDGTVGLHPCSVATTTSRLLAQSAVLLEPVDPAGFARLAALPALRLARPRDLARLDETTALLLAELSAPGGPSPAA